jgi:hypothetical protein
MTLKERFDLGNFITLVNDKPIKFQVFADHLDADSYDPLNQIPFYLFFTQIAPKDKEVIKSIVRISSDLRDFYFDNKDEEMYFQAVKFGLLKIQEKPDSKQFDFFTDEYERMTASIIGPGRIIREKILNFVFKINELYPSWKINPIDLRTNINANEDQIRDWAEDLVHVEYFVAERATPENKIYGGSIHRHYRINPKMRDQIEVDLNKMNDVKKNAQEHLEIFISYSHDDRIIAGKIKIQLEANGYRTFLAHDVIKVDKDWRLEILKHLKSCDILLALITDAFNESEWTHQEVGHCIGNGKMIISLRLGGRLEGYLEARQALTMEGDDAVVIAEKVISCIKDSAEFENVA